MGVCETKTEIHLLVERMDAGDRWGNVLVVEDSARPAFLVVGPDGPHLVTSQDRPCAALERIDGSTPRLAIVWHNLRGRVNALLAPPVAVVGSGDEIEFEGEHRWQLHVAVYLPGGTTSASGQIIGRECPLCLQRITAGALIYRCPCGCALHFAEPGETDQLNCASELGDCPNCHQPIVLSGRYQALPQECDVHGAVANHSRSALAPGH